MLPPREVHRRRKLVLGPVGLDAAAADELGLLHAVRQLEAGGEYVAQDEESESPDEHQLAAGQSVAVLDEPLLVVTLMRLEVVDRSMASPAPVEAPVQRGGFRCPSSGMIRFVKRCSRCGTSFSTSTSSSPTKKPRAAAAAGCRSSTSSRTARASR